MRHFLLFYDVDEEYLERRADFRGAHLEKAWAAHERGELVLGGALTDPVDGAVLLFALFAGESPAVAEAFAKADPYVTNGLVRRWRVREWTTVVGRDAATPVRAVPHRPEGPREDTGLMRYVFTPHGDTLVIEVHGPRWGELSQLGMKDEVRAAVAMGRRHFVIDLGHVSHITSLGLGILVAAWASIRQAGGVLKVCGVGPRVRASLEVCGLDRVLEECPSREEAVRDLESGR
jgi:anti-anti-sigma factor